MNIEKKLKSYVQLEPIVDFLNSELIFNLDEIGDNYIIKLKRPDLIKYLTLSRQYHEASSTIGAWEVLDVRTGELDESKYLKLYEERS